MNMMLIKKVLLSLTILHTTYLALIIGLYVDLTERINNPIMRILWTTAICAIGIFAYGAALDQDTIWTLLPMESTTVKNYLRTQIMPLVAQSLHTMGLLAILASCIDKLLYMATKRRMPYIFTLGFVSGGIYIAGATIHRILGVKSSKQNIDLLITQLQWVTPLISEPLLGIIIFLGAIIIAKLLRRITRKITGLFRKPSTPN